MRSCCSQNKAHTIVGASLRGGTRHGLRADSRRGLSYRRRRYPPFQTSGRRRAALLFFKDSAIKRGFQRGAAVSGTRLLLVMGLLGVAVLVFWAALR